MAALRLQRHERWRHQRNGQISLISALACGTHAYQSFEDAVDDGRQAPARWLSAAAARAQG